MTPPSSAALPEWHFHGQGVIISGGARGIGAGLVKQFARSGATVLFGDIDTIGAMELCAELAAEQHPVHFIEADFTTAGAWPLLRDAAQRLGLPPHLVIANVGISVDEPLEESTLATYERILNANTRSAWLAAHTFGPALRKTHGASLLLIGTVMTHFGTPGYSLYATSKAALSGLLRSLCVEYAPDGVRVNMIVPGFIINDPPAPFREEIPPPLWRDFHAHFGRELAASNPLAQPIPTWGQPADIAQAACFLHSPAARHITGVELPVDGGLLCQTPIPPSTGNAAWQWTEAMREWVRRRLLA